jgi:CRISPR/Cas system endoribonuclease Cas6 (RAMP superfamily)
MKMGGFVGEAEYRGKIAEFVPLLKLGEKLRVGKATGFGLGRYAIA